MEGCLSLPVFPAAADRLVFDGRTAFNTNPTYFLSMQHGTTLAYRVAEKAMLAPDPLLVALNRFGLGARGAAPPSLFRESVDPRAFVMAELNTSPLALPGQEQPNAAHLLQKLFSEQKMIRAAREALAASALPLSPHDPNLADPRPAPEPNIARDVYRGEALLRFQQAVRVPCGLIERLTAFWSNHFAISCFKAPFVRIIAGAYEREAIRPHVLGRFADMVLAVARHPAMIFYLDNTWSAGAHSQLARNNRKRGLNENLAREILELHTLGVNGGYTQADVTSLANMLTGWTYSGPEGRLSEPGTFAFVPQWHEPGPQRLLRRAFDQQGVAQGETALVMLCHEDATSRFIATKLVRHFVSDNPPPALVDRLAKIFRQTEGDLGAVTRALVMSDEAWSLPLTKMRRPRDFMMASLRLLGRSPEEPQRILNALNQLGEPLWSPPGPNGFPDTNAAWEAPEQVKLRLDIAAQMARQWRDPPNPSDLLQEVWGAAASDATREAVRRAESKQQGLALLLMSPEMQRR